MTSYAIFNDTYTRLKAADEAASPGAPTAIPGWLQTIIQALLAALGGGCLPPVATAADLTRLVAEDVNGYLESTVHAALLQNHGRIAARLLLGRAMKAIRHGSAALTPADDGYAASLQASAQQD